jgi:hypothetical protein
MSELLDTGKVYSADEVEILGATGTALATTDDDIRNKLPIFEDARAAIAKAVTIDECLAWESPIEMMKAYAYKSKFPQMHMNAAKLYLYNNRRLGELVAALKERGEILVGGSGRPQISDELVTQILADTGSGRALARKYGVSESTVSSIKKSTRSMLRGKAGRPVGSFGITCRAALRAQRIASIPEDKFNAWLSEQESRAKPPSMNACLSFANMVLSEKKKYVVQTTDAQSRISKLKTLWDGAIPSTRLTFLKWAIENAAPQTQQQFVTWLDQWFAEKQGAGKQR